MTTAVLSRYEIDVEDVEYIRHGNKPLLARVYKPSRGERDHSRSSLTCTGAPGATRTVRATPERMNRWQEAARWWWRWISGCRLTLDIRLRLPTSIMRFAGAKRGPGNWAAAPIGSASWASPAAAIRLCWRRCDRAIRATQRFPCQPRRRSMPLCAAWFCAGR